MLLAKTLTTIALPPFVDSFARDDGPAGNGWSIGIIASGKLTIPVAQGTEDISNGDFETGDPPTGWTIASNSTITSVADERTGGAGTASMSVVNNGAPASAFQTLQTAADSWGVVSAWVKRINSNPGVRIERSNATPIRTVTLSASDWTQVSFTERLINSNCRVRCTNGDSVLSREARYDDVSFKPLTQVMDSRDVGFVPRVVQVKLTRVSQTQVGIGIYVDGSNFLIAHLDGFGNVVLLKRVAGIYTSVATAAVSYIADGALQLDYDPVALTAAVSYEGVELIAAQSVTDSTFTTATKVCAFATDAASTFDDFYVSPIEPPLIVAVPGEANYLRIAQANDIHIENAEPQGYPGANDAATAWVAALDTMEYIDRVVINGDISNYASDQSFAAAFFASVANLRVTGGNHDFSENSTSAKASLASLYNMPSVTQPDGLITYYYAEDIKFARIIYMDTNWRDFGSGDVNGASLTGRIPDWELDWLQVQLDTTLPTIVFLHHFPQIEVWDPPPWFDEEDLELFTELLNNRPAHQCFVNGVLKTQAPTWVFGGHIHNSSLTQAVVGRFLGSVPKYALVPLFSGKHYTIELDQQGGTSPRYVFRLNEETL